MAREAAPAIARESFAWAEFVQLLADPVYYGAGVPRGDGRLVLVLPGLFGNDWYLQPLRLWLNRIGYRAVASSLRVNAGCPERLTRSVESALERRRKRTGGPVAMIGHSRGGILARTMASRLGEDVSHLILLGSPVGAIERWSGSFAGFRAAGNPQVVNAGNRARRLLDPDCNAPFCGCPFQEDLQRPLSPVTSVTSIFSREDPIVPAWATDLPRGRNIEVSGTHIGLAFNAKVYRELAEALSAS
jgi:pimeloyl-ACP methyl ester carboxylesterase